MTIIDAWLHPATVRITHKTEYKTGSNDKKQSSRSKIAFFHF